MKLRGRTIGALQWPAVTGVAGIGCSGQSGLSCQDGDGPPLGRVDQSVAFPLPAGEDSGHRGQVPYGDVQASPCDPGQVPLKPSCAPSSISSSCCQTKS